MSIETWTNEFYPVKAKDVEPKDAVQHSLTKWKGLLPENLSTHECVMSSTNTMISDRYGYNFFIDNESCALCLLYYDKSISDPCRNCPLYKSRNNYPCDDGGPYTLWNVTGNPVPMIEALEAVLSLE